MTPMTLTGRTSPDTHETGAGESFSLPDQTTDVTRQPFVGEGQTTRSAMMSTLPGECSPDGSDFPTDQAQAASHQNSVGGGTTRPTGAISPALPVTDAPRLDDPTLNAVAALVDDLEQARISAEHRIRILTRPADEPDEDGVFRGHGLPVSEVAPLQVIAEQLGKVEHAAVLQLQRSLRRHPLGPWVKATKGVGEKQAARLLAVIGDPYVNVNTGQPRTVSALWAYCGLHVLPADPASGGAQLMNVGGDQTGSGNPHQVADGAHDVLVGVAARRRKGTKANWSTVAKTRAYLIALSCLKQAESPYRAVYDARRAHTAVTRPEWTAGHSHNDGLRIASKAILRDMWREARRIHTGT